MFYVLPQNKKKITKPKTITTVHFVIVNCCGYRDKTLICRQLIFKGNNVLKSHKRKLVLSHFLQSHELVIRICFQ